MWGPSVACVGVSHNAINAFSSPCTDNITFCEVNLFHVLYVKMTSLTHFPANVVHPPQKRDTQFGKCAGLFCLTVANEICKQCRNGFDDVRNSLSLQHLLHFPFQYLIKQQSFTPIRCRHSYLNGTDSGKGRAAPFHPSVL